jgi:hypothetical protein
VLNEAQKNFNISPLDQACGTFYVVQQLRQNLARMQAT